MIKTTYKFPIFEILNSSHLTNFISKIKVSHQGYTAGLVACGCGMGKASMSLPVWQQLNQQKQHNGLVLAASANAVKISNIIRYRIRVLTNNIIVESAILILLSFLFIRCWNGGCGGKSRQRDARACGGAKGVHLVLFGKLISRGRTKFSATKFYNFLGVKIT